MKRFLSVVLAIALLLTCAPAIPLTANAATSGSYTYKVSNGKATITDCNTSISGDITIPATLGGYPVTGIGSSAFGDCSSLTSVVIPDSVTSIDWYAFRNCSSLRSVAIPDSVTSIGSYAFSFCSSLTGIWVDADNTAYCSDEQGVLYNKNKNTLIQAPAKGITGTYTIPDSVTSIGDSAFYSCSSLTSVVIGDSVTSIGSDAFQNCSSLTSVVIGDSVTDISGYAFSGCSSLTSVAIPDSVTNIGSGAFYNCSSLTSVVIGDSVTSIGSSAFSSCSSLTSVVIGDSVTSISSSAFSGCSSLTSITIPESVVSIGGSAFSGCRSLANVYYEGTELQRAFISVSSGNNPLLTAKWTYVRPAKCVFIETGKETVTQYASLEEALVAATSGTIKLLADATVDALILNPGIALDLNGHTLTARYLVVAKGAEILDSGALKVAKDNLVYAQENGNGIIPVWNGTDGYIFTKVTFQQLARPLGNGAAQYIFLPSFSNAEASALLADGGADNGLKLKVSLIWNDEQSQQLYTYKDSFVKDVFASNGKLAFSLTVTGIAGIEDMAAQAVVVTDTGAQATNTSTAIIAG